MTALLGVFLFCLGLALGSFLHVLAWRYDPDRFLLTRKSLGGRSHCPRCKKTLGWRELAPLFSFIFQRGRCRACGVRIGQSYFWTELACGLTAVLVPWMVLRSGGGAPEAALWTLAFLVLILMTLIDLRLQVIPDELVAALIAIGLALGYWGGPLAGAAAGLAGEGWAGRFAAGAGAALFFGGLVAVTRGRGMGLGDVKLAFALGLLFAWPGILLLVMLAFVIGAAVGVGLIVRGAKSMKSAVPFGPFLAVAAAIVFFGGQVILENWYNLLI